MKGFSLIELLTSLAILTVLVVISLPKYRKYTEKSESIVFHRMLRDVARATLSCAANSPFNKCDELAELGIQSMARQRSVFAASVCYRFARHMFRQVKAGCVSIDVSEGTYKIVQDGRYCYKLDPDPLDPSKTIKAANSPPLNCKKRGANAPDCPAAFPYCGSIKGASCSPAAACG